MKKALTIMLIFCFAVLPAASPASAEAIHHFSVRNFTDEGIEVEIRFFSGGGERFTLGRDACSERTLRFDSSCGYEICAWGLSGGQFYGCREIQTCADAGITFFVNRGPEVDGDRDCDYGFEDDDDFDTQVAVWCFIGSVADSGPGP
ncbi:MAG: hypothetical protein ACOC3W_05420 [Thermodesulfobacteriota bacterium]